MNKHIRAFIIISVLVVVILVLGIVVSKKFNSNKVSQNQQSVQNQGIVGTTTSGGHIIIDNIAPGQTIHTPFTVTGVMGGWYFEGSFPIFMKDANGNQIGAVAATSSQDWMTSNAIPFSATLPAVTYTGPGALVFHNDNPSGEPQYDDSYTVNVIFQ
jgi:hypothetical protein